MKMNLLFRLAFMQGMSWTCCLCSMAQASSATSLGKDLPLTFARAEDLLMKNDADMRRMDYAIEAQKGALQQSKLWDNPELTVMYGLNNPSAHRYLTLSKGGEVDVQVSQAISIGGQRKLLVKENEALLSVARYDKSDTWSNKRADMQMMMVDLDLAQARAKLLQKQVATLDTIITAYGKQVMLGNLPAIELQRLKAQRFSTQKDCLEAKADVAELQRSLSVLLGVPSEGIHPVIATSQILHNAATYQLALTGRRLSAVRPDLLRDSMAVAAATHDYLWQRSQALPKVSLQGEYDKEGNIGHNFFAIGVNVSIPIFNKNQGNIRSAKTEIDNRRNTLQAGIRQAESDLALHVTQLTGCLHALDDSGMTSADGLALTLGKVKEQYIRRNISLLEFLDAYNTYADTYSDWLEMRANGVKTVIEINRDCGEDVIPLERNK